MSIRTINQLSFIFIRIYHLPTSTSGTFCCIEITSEDMCEIQPRLYLISSSDSNRFYPCKVNLITRQVGTQGVPHGNLSLAHTEVITVASHPRILSSLTCAWLRAGCFQHVHSPCPQKEGNPSSKAYSASNLVILQATSVYRAHKHGM